MKPDKCGFADFENVYNWIIDSMIQYINIRIKLIEDYEDDLGKDGRIKIIRVAATTIFLSYEKELIGKTNVPACKPETLEKIVNCREELINILDKFNKHESNDIERKIESIRLELRNLN